jgi:micrococcal nuclease
MLKIRRTAGGALTLLLLVAGAAGCSSSPVARSTPVSTGLVPRGPIVSDVPVLRVVDGDTLHVLIDGRDTTVRLLGINTPETVKPNSPVECFGPEASAYAKQALEVRRVTLEFDDSQGRLDRYGRTLAYVWIPVETGGLDLVNLDLVAQGFAYQRQYGSDPVAWQPELVAAQNQARESGTGLWGACAP